MPDNDKSNPLNNFSVILHHPKEAGNMGSVSRAMHNTGFSDLVLINPVERMTGEGRKFAMNGLPILENARVLSSFDEALEGMDLMVAFTRRAGQRRGGVTSFDDEIDDLVQRSTGQKIGLVFGTERTGLPVEIVKRCPRIVSIPAAPENPSYNLSQAVLLACFMLQLRIGKNLTIPEVSSNRIEEPTAKELEGALLHLDAMLLAMDFLKPTPRVAETLRRFFMRANPDKRDLRIWRALFRDIIQMTGSDNPTNLSQS